MFSGRGARGWDCPERVHVGTPAGPEEPLLGCAEGRAGLYTVRALERMTAEKCLLQSGRGLS